MGAGFLTWSHWWCYARNKRVHVLPPPCAARFIKLLLFPAPICSCGKISLTQSLRHAHTHSRSHAQLCGNLRNVKSMAFCNFLATSSSVGEVNGFTAYLFIYSFKIFEETATGPLDKKEGLENLRHRQGSSQPVIEY